jgi:hypothetical protein
MSKCPDMPAAGAIKQPEDYSCKVCTENGTEWVHLRTCQTCSETLCCDSSPNRHMTAHFHATGHPVVISAEPGEKWMWCYTHEQLQHYL